MICQGMYVVLAICLVVAVVVKVSALSFALPQRCGVLSSAPTVTFVVPLHCRNFFVEHSALEYMD
uniref:Uncharacterized protein LOC105129087 n=1 Tax=Rhizophora mucronata TaxID=61149 RepID=A0A2P2KGZ8_RHIMU